MNTDSLIFDMDGTLWDNVDTYVEAWNKGLSSLGHNKTVNRNDLIGLMGKDARKILDVILPNNTTEQQDVLFDAVLTAYQNLIPTMQPTIFPYVKEGLEQLARHYPLFLLSNCEKGGLVNFMEYTKTTHLFTDYMEYGQNQKPKSINLKLLMMRNNIKQPVYVGDTESDSKEAKKAHIPFVYVTYGFGNTEHYTLKFDDFRKITEYFLDKK